MLVVIPIAENNGEFLIVLVLLFGWMDDKRSTQTINILALHRGQLIMSATLDTE